MAIGALPSGAPAVGHSGTLLAGGTLPPGSTLPLGSTLGTTASGGAPSMYATAERQATNPRDSSNAPWQGTAPRTLGALVRGGVASGGDESGGTLILDSDGAANACSTASARGPTFAALVPTGTLSGDTLQEALRTPLPSGGTLLADGTLNGTLNAAATLTHALSQGGQHALSQGAHQAGATRVADSDVELVHAGDGSLASSIQATVILPSDTSLRPRASIGAAASGGEHGGGGDSAFFTLPLYDTMPAGSLGGDMRMVGAPCCSRLPPLARSLSMPRVSMLHVSMPLLLMRCERRLVRRSVSAVARAPCRCDCDASTVAATTCRWCRDRMPLLLNPPLLRLPTNLLVIGFMLCNSRWRSSASRRLPVLVHSRSRRRRIVRRDCDEGCPHAPIRRR